MRDEKKQGIIFAVCIILAGLLCAAAIDGCLKRSELTCEDCA